MHITLTPAYGRDYKSKAAVEKDFIDGKDFRICDMSSPDDGRYCSIRDFKKGDKVTIRYSKLMKSSIFQQ